MSHIVTVKAEIRDPLAVQAACQRLKLNAPVQGKAQLFSSEAAGLLIALPGWQYPVVCDTTTGQLHYDNFAGRWGDQAELDRFLQAYSVCKAVIEARRKGYRTTEQQLPDGSIKVTIEVGGGTA